MITALSTAIIAVALLAALWAVILVVIDRPTGTFLLGLLALLELALLAQAVAGFVLLGGTDRDVAGLSFVGYLVAILFVLPIAAVWALAERSRWGAGVLVVACLTIPVMVIRAQQIWNGAGA